MELLALDGAGPWAAAARAQSADAVVRAAIDTAGFRFGKLASMSDVSFLPGGAKYGDLPGMLALGTPGELWLAGEGDEVPRLVQAAYDAAGAGDKVTPYGGSDDAKAAAAIEWLSRP